MCRHLAYLGPTTGLDELLFGAPHALVHQAQHPRLQLWGDDNPHGWGVAWYPTAGRRLGHYRTTTPIWDDHEFEKYAAELRGSAFVAAARYASPGAQIVETGNAPFVEDHWACSLNGIVDGFPDGVGDELRAQLDPRRRAALVGDADTEVLFALLLQRIHAGAPPLDALAAVVHDVLARTTGRLNLLLTQSRSVYATRVGNSLFRRGFVIASEPTDDEDGWIEIPDHSVTVLDPRGATEYPL
jgi:glutamine amidotransferase